MKRLLVISMILVAILAMSVLGDVVLSPSDISLTTKPTAGFTRSFKVTNNGTTNLTGLSVALTTAELNNFNISFNPSSLNLNAGDSRDVVITGTVPKNVNTRTNPYSGTVTVGSGSLTLNVNAEGQLRLDSVKVKVDGKSESLDNGDKIDNVKPKSTVVFTGDIENRFSDNDDIDIEDVEITITIEDIDDGDELEESEEVGDIKADDQEKFTIEFEIPDDVEDGDYDVIILVEGEDENGAKHAVEWRLTLQLEKDKHDIWITKAAVSPTTVSCSRNIYVNVDLKNQGRSDEDEVVVRIESSALGISFEDSNIPDIEEGVDDEDTEYSASYPFTIGDKVAAGTYAITVNAYYDTDTLSDSKRIDLKVDKCTTEEEPPVTDDKQDTVVVVTPPKDEPKDEEPTIITEPITETTEVGLLNSNVYLLFLIGAIGVAFIVVIILIVMLFAMKKRQ